MLTLPNPQYKKERVNNSHRLFVFIKTAAVLFCAGFLFLGLAAKAEAATLYVNSDSDGSASNPTRAFDDPSYTANNSYATLTACDSAASTGDICEFSGGTTGKSYAAKAGTIAKALTLQGSQISGHNGTVTITRSSGTYVISPANDGVVLKRLTLTGSGTITNILYSVSSYTAQFLVLNGAGASSPFIYNAAASAKTVLIEDTVVNGDTGGSGSGGFFSLVTSGTTTLNRVYIKNTSGAPLDGRAITNANDCIFDGTPSTIGVYLQGASAVGTFKNCIITGMQQKTIQIDSGGVGNFTNCVFINNGTSGYVYNLVVSSGGTLNTTNCLINGLVDYPQTFKTSTGTWNSTGDTFNAFPYFTKTAQNMGYVTISTDDQANVDYFKTLADYAMNTYGIPLTFFVDTTYNISAANKTTLQTLYKAGHEIGIHTRHHIDLQRTNAWPITYSGTSTDIAFVVNASGTSLSVTGSWDTHGPIDLTASSSYSTLALLCTLINTWSHFSCGTQIGGYLSNSLKSTSTVLSIGVATNIPLDDDTTGNNRLYKEEITNSINDLETALHEDPACAAYTVKTMAFPFDSSTSSVVDWVRTNTNLIGARASWPPTTTVYQRGWLGSQDIYRASEYISSSNDIKGSSNYSSLTDAQKKDRIEQAARLTAYFASKGFYTGVLTHNAADLFSLTEFEQFLNELVKYKSIYNIKIDSYSNIINEIKTSGNWTASSTAGYYTRTFTGSDDYTPLYNSSLIDAGTSSVSLTTDYIGNPIYGTPDIGGYEYQPPHTIGTNNIDIGAGARIYSDGKFRDVNATSGVSANLSITPSSGSFTVYGSSSTPRNAYLDVSVSAWSSTEKTWTESNASSGIGNTLHTIGDLSPNNYYSIAIDGADAATKITGANCSLLNSREVCQANSSSQVVFTYTGSYSTHTFDVTQTSGPAVASGGGGGMPSSWYNPPQTPIGGFSVLINNGNQTTTDSNVTLNLKGGTDTARMAISNTADFAGVSQEAYTQTKTWNLCAGLTSCTSGAYTVYAKFFAPWGTASNVVSDSIILNTNGISLNTNQTQALTQTATQSFTKDLKFGNINADVKRLQIFLNQNPDTQVAKLGAGSPGQETNFFGILTKAAVIKFQEKYTEEILTPWALAKGTGFVGKTTRAKINKILGF